MRGIFQREDLNYLQEKILISVEVRKRKEERDLEEMRFENSMLINNPQMYKDYVDKKKEESDSEGNPIIWAVPETIEEARELEKIFAEVDELTKKSKNKEADEEFIRQISMMGLFNDIDIDKIGGE